MNYTIFGAHLIEEQALSQFHDAINRPWAVKAALMPDSHLGYSLPIGGVVAVEDHILPQWVGYDIGCGMSAVKTVYNVSYFTPHIKQYVHTMIHQHIPIGLGRSHTDVQQIEIDLPCTDVCKKLFEQKGLRDFGTLGSGNHFIEIGVDEADNVWIIIHSGSRGFGYAVAEHYMKIANDNKEGQHNPLHVNSEEGQAYINDMNFCLQFALENRYKMLYDIGHILVREIERVAGDGYAALSLDTLINRNHNHAELKDGLWIHRKGATHSEHGMLGVIPGSMASGSYIVKGKGNADSLCSSSHGAGRRFNRNHARRTLDLQTFKKQMENIVADVGQKTLDESPNAYKDVTEVLAAQHELIEIISHIRPLINVKGVDPGRR